MFNDDESRRRTDQMHENLKRQQEQIRKANAERTERQRDPRDVRQQLSQYRRSTDR